MIFSWSLSTWLRISRVLQVPFVQSYFASQPCIFVPSYWSHLDHCYLDHCYLALQWLFHYLYRTMLDDPHLWVHTLDKLSMSCESQTLPHCSFKHGIWISKGKDYSITQVNNMESTVPGSFFFWINYFLKNCPGVYIVLRRPPNHRWFQKDLNRSKRRSTCFNRSWVQVLKSKCTREQLSQVGTFA